MLATRELGQHFLLHRGEARLAGEEARVALLQAGEGLLGGVVRVLFDRHDGIVARQSTPGSRPLVDQALEVFAVGAVAADSQRARAGQGVLMVTALAMLEWPLEVA